MARLFMYFAQRFAISSKKTRMAWQILTSDIP